MSRMSRETPRRRPGLVLCTVLGSLLLAQCTDRSPIAPEPDPQAETGDVLLGAVRCTASVSRGTVSCMASPVGTATRPSGLTPAAGAEPDASATGSMTSSAGSIILGGQGVYVRLANGTITKAGDAFSVPVTVQNLIGQALGTEDGTTVAASGIRVFFVQEPVMNGGTGSIELQGGDVDGTGTFTAAGQKYYQYASKLDPSETSGERTWTFRFTGDPTFSFSVLVWAPVQYADGWVQVAPTSASLAVDATQQLTGTVRDFVGRVQGEAAVTWESSDDAVATVSSTGLVTAVAPGTATITAGSDGSTEGSVRTGSAQIAVGTAPAAVADDYSVARNGTLTETAAGGVLENDDRGSPQAVVSSFGGGSLGGTVTTHAAGATVSPLPQGSGSLTVAADGGFTFTPPTDFTGSYTFSYRIGNEHGSSDATVTVDVVGANDAAYPETVLGNVSVNSANVTPTPFSVTANDAIAADATITFAGWNSSPGVTEQGGALVMQTSGADRGRFTYNPPAGYTGTDRFTYTVNSGGATSSAEVTLSVAGMIWFVDSSAPACTDVAAGCGRLSNPFSSLAAFNTANTGTGRNPADGHNVFLFGGTHTGPVTLRADQRLIGQNASQTLAIITGLTPGSGSTALPAMGTATSIGGGSGGIVLGSGNTLRGFAMTTSGGTAVSGTNFGTLTTGADWTMNVTGGKVFSLNTGTVGIDLATIGSGSAFSVTNVAGSISMAAGSLTDAGEVVFYVNGGAPTISFGGSITATGAARPVLIDALSGGSVTLSGTVTSSSALGILVQNNTGGTVAFNGSSKSLTTGANPAVTLTNNTGAVIAFTNGGLAITTTTGAGFAATGGGTVTVAGSGNTIATGTGTALQVANTAIGGANLTFQSISANGSTNGILLNGTGAGTLAVTGTGGAGSGGTIQNTTGYGVSLTSTAGATLTNLNVTGGAGGITGSSFGTLTVGGNTISATGAPALNLVTGNVNGTFASVSATASSSVGVSLNAVGGTWTVAAGSVAGSASGAALALSGNGGGGTIDWNGDLSQANSQPLISVSNHSNGTFNANGVLSATSGTGLQFSAATGTYHFNNTAGTTTLNGGDAGIDLLSGSNGTFVFGRAASPASFALTHGGATANQAFFASGSSPTVTYHGNITKSAGTGWLVDIFNQAGGSITFQNGTLTANNVGGGILLNNADGTVSFNGTTGLAGSARARIGGGSSGAITFGSGTTVTNPAGAGIFGLDIENGGQATSVVFAGTVSSNANNPVRITGVGSGTVTVSGNITATAQGLLVTGNGGGTIAFSGTSKSVNTGANAAVTLTSNTGATVNFTGGGLAIATTSGGGFSATGGGTVNVTGANNTISSGTGTALNVQNTGIGATGLTFVSISANGGANGIVLVNTGTAGGLQVTGNGSTPGSGGTLQNTIGSDGAVAGNGIYLENTRNVNLAWMQINDHQNNGIRGHNVVGLTMNKVRVIGANGTTEAGPHYESAVFFTELTGSASVSNSYFSGGKSNNFRLSNTSGTLNRLTMTGDTFAVQPGNPTNRLLNDALLVQGLGSATVNATIQNTVFESAGGDLFQYDLGGTAIGDLVLTGNAFSNNHSNIASGGGGVVLSAGGGGSPTFTYQVTGNSFRDALGTALVVSKTSGTGTATGTIANNSIGVAGAAHSGSAQGSGIDIGQVGGGTHTVTITGNTIRQFTNPAGILMQVGNNTVANGGQGRLKTVIQSNLITELSPSVASLGIATNGIHIQTGTNTGDNLIACATIGGAGSLANTVNGTGANGGTDIRLRALQSTVLVLPGMPGNPAVAADRNNFLTSNNESGETASSVTGGSGSYAATCPF